MKGVSQLRKGYLTDKLDPLLEMQRHLFAVIFVCIYTLTGLVRLDRQQQLLRCILGTVRQLMSKRSQQ